MSSEATMCQVRCPKGTPRRERRVHWVVGLTAVTMVVEIAFGYLTHSMALLADGWHMATHVGALGLAGAAYFVARRFAEHPAFGFGTGKVHTLAGYSSSLALGAVAVFMTFESAMRLLSPREIDFESSIPVAIIGLVVNLLSAWLLHDNDSDGSAPSLHAHDHAGHDNDSDGSAPSLHAHDHAGHEHESHAHRPGATHEHECHEHRPGAIHDHNHRAAFAHVLADALTSVLAIGALLAGRHLGWWWLDALSGILGGLLILRWSVGLCRAAAFELLDIEPGADLEKQIRRTLEALDGVTVADLHVWHLGQGARSCVVTVVSQAPRDPAVYRRALLPFGLAHLTIEVAQPGQSACSKPLT
ncbi:MAG: CDF family Co(II)/Ni(II) efflux transporter DmeF [Polyangiaceae bacterium]